MSTSASLWALFGSSFLAATLLPGGSEAVLFGVLKAHPALFWSAIAVATIGNVLGGMSSYLLGRLFPEGRKFKHVETVRRYGSPILLMSWVPLVGDSLCLAAGWLRLNPWSSGAFMAAGKFARYIVVAWTIAGVTRTSGAA